MDQIIIHTTVGLAVATTSAIIYLINKRNRRNQHLEKIEKPSFNRKKELFNSFRYREAFKINSISMSDDQRVSLMKKPLLESQVLENFQQSSSSHGSISSLHKLDYSEFCSDFKCPISGLFMQDPVVLNGYLYDRENIEDWIYVNDWSDPMQSWVEEDFGYYSSMKDNTQPVIAVVDDKSKTAGNLAIIVDTSQSKSFFQSRRKPTIVQVSPDDIKECSPEFLDLFNQFVCYFQEKIQTEGNDMKSYSDDSKKLEEENHFEFYFESIEDTSVGADSKNSAKPSNIQLATIYKDKKV